VRTLVTDSGHEMVSSADDADVAIFNSCAVTSEAEADLRQEVRRVGRRNSAVRSVVMGCAAALDRGGIRSLPTVEHVVPGADLDELVRVLSLESPAAAMRTRAQSTVRATLRIQDGCNEHCTFCATTVARGSARSRPATELLAEARQLAERHPEVVLTGVHIGSWGVEFDATLGDLVAALVHACPTTRFRLSSLEATEVDARLAELFGSGQLVPHLHAPLQSGSDRVLRRMGRHWYTAARYARAVEQLVKGRPVFGLGADVIAGFPGESDADHAATLALINDLPFSYLHVFPYSPRPGTAAPRLGAIVPQRVADERAAELRSLAARKAGEYRARRAGTDADVVVTRGGPRSEGVTEDYLTVRLAGPMARGARFVASLGLENGTLVAMPRIIAGDEARPSGDPGRAVSDPESRVSHYLSAS
jgi:threonylcarbamoyladenosine tRNA methylthiotransferase MtaB